MNDSLKVGWAKPTSWDCGEPGTQRQIFKMKRNTQQESKKPFCKGKERDMEGCKRERDRETKLLEMERMKDEAAD